MVVAGGGEIRASVSRMLLSRVSLVVSLYKLVDLALDLDLYLIFILCVPP